MPRSGSSFGARVRGGHRLLGALVRMPNEGLVELAGLVGLDFVVIDTEHGPGDQIALQHHILAAHAGGTAVLVRIGSATEILRALDLGAEGIIAPHVSSPAQAQHVVQAAHYPPRGQRGFATYTRAGRYGLSDPVDHLTAGAETVVIAMIEDAAGLAASHAIAAVEGIDGLLLGPADFACELEITGQTQDPRVQNAASTVRSNAQANHRTAVSIVSNASAAQHSFTAGNSMVIYNVQHALGALFTELAHARADSIGPPPSSEPEPLVLLSGMLGDASEWDEVAAALGDGAAVRTSRIDLDDSIAEMAQSVLAEAPATFALAGHSLGAIVAMEIARRAPSRVTRLALLNASGRAASDTQQAAWAEWAARVSGGEFAAVAAELAQATLPTSKRGDPHLVGRNERMAYTVGGDGFLRQLTAQHTRPDSLATLGQLKIPVIIVTGELDEVCPPILQEELTAAFTEATHVRIADTGHMTPLEAPEQVAAHLRQWLRRSVLAERL